MSKIMKLTKPQKEQLKRLYFGGKKDMRVIPALVRRNLVKSVCNHDQNVKIFFYNLKSSGKKLVLNGHCE